MSTPTPPQYAPFQSYPQPPAPKKRFNWKLALAMFAAVIIGGIIGSVSNPAPPPVVQVQEKRVEVEKKVTETPASCIAALGYAEDHMASSQRVVGIFVQVLDAIKVSDYTEIGRLNPKIRDETAIIKDISPKYLTESDDCRASK